MVTVVSDDNEAGEQVRAPRTTTRQTRAAVAVFAASLIAAAATVSAVAAPPPTKTEPAVTASNWDDPHGVTPGDANHNSTRLGGDTEISTRSTPGESGARHIVLVVDADALNPVIGTIDGAVRTRYDTGFYGFSADLTDTDITTLANDPRVLSVEEDHRLDISATQTDPPWGLDRIDQRTRPLDGKYTYTSTGAGVDMYIVDSGIWFTHVDFAGRVAEGAYWDFNDGFGPWDCNGHGTHVAGTAGGTRYGVAKQVTLIPVRVTDCQGGGPLEAILAGISWVINDHRAGQPAVANMSLGGPASSSVDAAVNALIADGVTVVAAAGNDAYPTCGYSPARVAAVITVAASTANDLDAPFSNYGACNDLFAPGVNILSAAPSGNDSGSSTRSGTSMAAPHVAGVAALILEDSPNRTPHQVWATMDANITRGQLSVCCGDPNKLLYSAPAASPSPPPPTTTPPPPTPAPTPPQTESFVSRTPARIADTRAGTFTIDGQSTGSGKLVPGTTFRVRIGGRAGVATDASAVAVTATISDPSGPGYLTLWPCGVNKPEASNVNYMAAGQVIAATAVVKLGTNGDLCAQTHDATVDLIIDVVGYFPATSEFTPVTPARLLDTRPGAPSVDGEALVNGPLDESTSVRVQVAGRAGVAADATAVTVNLTVTGTEGWGFATADPCLHRDPNTSSLNWVDAGQTVANTAVVKLDAGGGFCIGVYGSAAHLLVDLAGTATGDSYRPVSPFRLIDTRPTHNRRTPGDVVGVQLPTSADAATLNVTITDTEGWGYATVWPCGTQKPEASSVNWTSAGQTVANTTIAKPGADNMICIEMHGSAAHVMVDVSGYFVSN